MKVILLKEVKGRGGEGDVIEVKDGFANNYLIKDGLAVKATKGALKQLDERRKNIEKREEVRLEQAKELQEKINGLKFKVDVQIGDEGQLFGAVTTQMIADGIKKNAEVEIDKRRIDIRKAIKTVGLHKAEVTIYRDIKADIEVIVGDEDAEKFLEALKAKKDKKSGNRGFRKPDKKAKEKKDANAENKTEASVEENAQKDVPAEAEEQTETAVQPEPTDDDKPAQEPVAEDVTDESVVSQETEEKPSEDSTEENA